MTAEDGKCGELLVDQRLGRQGLEVKLDRGFESGVYCGYIEFEALASRVGFAAAHRRATDYCTLLWTQLARLTKHSVGEIEDPSYMGNPRRKRNLELTYLTFPIFTCDSRCHDNAVKEEFRLALLRAGQQWDQVQAREDTRRHASRRDAFRANLGSLLASDAYSQLDEAAKQRLLDDVTALAFPPRGLAR
jgi:hypothetical protein